MKRGRRRENLLLIGRSDVIDDCYFAAERSRRLEEDSSLDDAFSMGECCSIFGRWMGLGIWERRWTGLLLETKIVGLLSLLLAF